MPEPSDHGYPVTGSLAGLAAVLGGLLPVATVEARRELLDVVAVAAGLKPVAVIGFSGAAVTPEPEEFTPLGLSAQLCTAWASAGEFDGVPPWYEEAVRKHRSTTPLLAISLKPDSLSALPNGDAATLDPADEAALLGYPPCCTAAHAGWRARLHHVLAAATLAAAGNDCIRAYRMVAANWAPTLRPEAIDDPSLLTRRCALPTGIVMCPDCAANPDGPAGKIATAYASLANWAGLSGLFEAGAV